MRLKYRARLAARSTGLVSLIALGCAYNFLFRDEADLAPVGNPEVFPSMESRSSSRLLLAEGRCAAKDDTNSTESAFPKALEPGTEWLIVIFIPVILYTFLALAIICDEYFVPALEVMVDEDNLNLSPDVSGATFMAAGGSAPELFTSFIGTMQESSVGFGTIVGSAVFNVLFVIAMCAFFSKEVLTLTWWPLARDSIYYTISLCVLGIFFAVTSEGEIMLWEALILFLMYFGYVVLMFYNEKLYFALGFGKEGEGGDAEDGDEAAKAAGPKDGCRTMQFRVGIMNLVMNGASSSLKDQAAMHVVTKIEGDALTTFNRLSSNGHSGEQAIQATDLKTLFLEMEINATDEQVDEVRKELDLNGDGQICWDEFKQWYNSSEDRVREEMQRAFDKIASVSVMEDPNCIDAVGLRAVLKEIGGMKELNEEEFEKQLDVAMDDIDTNEDGLIQRAEFYKWYENSMFWALKNADIGEGISNDDCSEEDDDDVDSLVWPADADCSVKAFWIMSAPLNYLLAYTVPNCAQDYEVCGVHVKKLCWLGFFLSIAWIGVFSFVMVLCAEKVGDTIGIPAQIMGLTFLAAGTSVPDLLSSIVVAQQGQGDMAVSSSIGSNIFDVLVGLPLPWLTYNIIMGQSVCVGAKSLQVSIFILIVMLMVVIAIIHFSGWKMTTELGIMMVIFYVLFVIQDLLRDETLICDGGCF